METLLFTIGDRPVTLGEALVVSGLAAALLLAVAIVVIVRARGAARRMAEEATTHTRALEEQVRSLVSTQAEMSGRMQTMAELFGGRQAELNKAISERLDGMSHKMHQSMGEATRNTHENLKRLHERLAVLDAAQTNINDLTGQVSTLTNILANKQSRGAFGQGRMEAIISDNLPPGAFEFQVTLKTGARPDCAVYMPNGAPPLVIDAKFPLEGFNAVRAAGTPEALKTAEQQFRGDLIKHVKDIKDRYLVPGETQDTAFMFVPSESVFAEIHERFDDVVQRAYRARVVIVSPTLLLLSIQVTQALLRDARLREQADVIRDEVLKLMQDVERLDDRVRKLSSHFNMAQKDIDQILISTEKVTKRGRGIESIGLGEREAVEQPPQQMLLAGE